MKAIRVLLADDHAMVLEGLCAVLKPHEEIVICGEVKSGQEVLDFVNLNLIDVIVLDIRMPEMDGLTCARKIRELHPDLKIIILTMHAGKSVVDQLVKIGVHGCLLKSNTGNELREAILRVASGKSYFDLIQAIQSEPGEPIPLNLSKREIEIIKLIAEGLTSYQIAEHLFIAEHTVKTHRKNLTRKIGVHNISQLIQFARNNQLL